MIARPSGRTARQFGGALLALALWIPASAWATSITFRYQPVIGGVSAVAVAGSFNEWNATANSMADADQDGVWEVKLDLKPGRFEYKFVVNGDQWFVDESAAEFVDDKHGGKNSLLEVKDQPLVAGTGSTVARAAAAPVGMHRVTFRYKPATKPETVHLAGSFNDWNMSRTPMTDADGDGTYETTLLLPAKEYTYKFVVNSGTWIPDPEHQDADVDDNFGGKNSIVRVDDRFPAIKTARGDGEIASEGITHEQGANEVNNMGEGRVEFTTRAHRGDVTGVDLVTYAGGAEKATPMILANQDQAFEYYRATVTLPAGETPYLFRYRDGAKSTYLTSAGFAPGAGQNRFAYSEERSPAFVTPDWVKNAVIYQIFPDRFRNGSTANDPDFKEWYYQGKNLPPPSGTKLNVEFQEYYHLIKDWNDAAALTQAPHMPEGRDWMGFYGGDIEGVRQSLDYLKDLGVTAIYFNPIFQAKSTHKYDCADYRKIDPHFGTNEEFIAFVKEAKAKGIRVILDIVYNHAGNGHWAFKDAAEKGTKSPNYNWFEFKRWPLPDGWPSVGHPWKPADYYYCWWGYGDLPDLNFDLSRKNDAEKDVRDIAQAQPNLSLIHHLLETTEYWLREADVDGVRLDVPNEVPFWFWKVFNQRVKKVKPDAYIVGELWGQASDYVRPGVYDAVMNYAFFRDPVTKFLGMGQGSAAEFDATLAGGRLAYPTQAVQVQMNLIDSHDTVRFLTQVNGNLKRLELAAMFAMTYTGAPTIYYGDEIGMEGGKDPDCRRPFLWNWKDDPKRVALHDYYKKLAAARIAAPALRTGTFRTVVADGMVYAYARGSETEDYLVVLNAGKSPAQVPVDLAVWGGKVGATDLMSGERAAWSGTATVAVPAEAGRMFKLEKAAATGSR